MGCFAPTEPPLGGVSVAFGTSLRLRSRTVSVVEVPSRSDALARFFALTGPTLLGLVAAARVGSSRWAGGSSCWAVDVVALARAGLAGSSTKPWSRPKSSSRFRNSEFTVMGPLLLKEWSFGSHSGVILQMAMSRSAGSRACLAPAPGQGLKLTVVGHGSTRICAPRTSNKPEKLLFSDAVFDLFPPHLNYPHGHPWMAPLLSLIPVSPRKNFRLPKIQRALATHLPTSC